jgi:hypothetical protein
LIGTLPNYNFSVIEKHIGADLVSLQDKIDKFAWSKTKMASGKEIEEYLTEEYVRILFGRFTSLEDVEQVRMFVFLKICERILAKNSPNAHKCAKKAC